jgi:hypothetical protein
MFATDEDRWGEEDWKKGLSASSSSCFGVRAHAQQHLFFSVDEESDQQQQQQQLPALA